MKIKREEKKEKKVNWKIGGVLERVWRNTPGPKYHGAHPHHVRLGVYVECRCHDYVPTFDSNLRGFIISYTELHWGWRQSVFFYLFFPLSLICGCCEWLSDNNKVTFSSFFFFVFIVWRTRLYESRITYTYWKRDYFLWFYSSFKNIEYLALIFFLYNMWYI